jgi:hypothetical protein
MIGINGKPYIDLDPFLDVEGFKNLHLESCYGISRSVWDQGNYGPGVYDRSKPDLFWTEADLYTRRHPDWEEIAQLQFKDINERRKYLKLRYGIYNPSSTIYLRKPVGRDYHSIAEASANPWTANCQFFPNVVKWVKELPFAELGRVLFFVHEHDCDLVKHSDLKHSGSADKKYIADKPHEAEFIWIRPNKDKGFFVWDEVNDVKHHVTSYSAWFNSFDVHGGDPTPMMTYSLRADGVFTDEFRAKVLG